METSQSKLKVRKLLKELFEMEKNPKYRGHGGTHPSVIIKLNEIEEAKKELED